MIWELRLISVWFHMNIKEHENEIELCDVTDFDLARIFECGQCFRWNVDGDGVYSGVAFDKFLRVRREHSSVFISGSRDDFDHIWYDYFDLSKDYEKIRKLLSIDDFMKKATNAGKGIRILRQDKWETLCSFIISQRNNIPRIKKIVEALCSEFGDRVEDKLTKSYYYTFPKPQVIASLTTQDLAPISCGYRDKYIISAAKDIVQKNPDLDMLPDAAIEIARNELLRLHGVGNKVADCVLLFGLHKLDAFPVDVWMERAVLEHYGKDFDSTIFSPYSGIAQQYIFDYVRNTQNGK